MIRRQLPGFHEYFNQLKEKYLAGTNPRNPWYEEYYQTYQQCSHNTNRTVCHFKERFKKITVRQKDFLMIMIFYLNPAPASRT